MIKRIFLVVIAMLMLSISAEAQYQELATDKLIKSDRDTTLLPGLTESLKKVTITNDGPGTLGVFLSYSGNVFPDSLKHRLDSTKYFRLDSGRALIVNTTSTRVFRHAVVDSCTSQITVGDVQFNFNFERHEFHELTLIYNYDYEHREHKQTEIIPAGIYIRSGNIFISNTYDDIPGIGALKYVCGKCMENGMGSRGTNPVFRKCREDQEGSGRA
jgi:hypothetical protein